MLEAMISIVLLLNIVIGFYAAGTAAEKGHDGTTWFFMGLVFGVVALAIINIAPDEKANRKYRESYNRLALSVENIEKRLEKIEYELAEKR